MDENNKSMVVNTWKKTKQFKMYQWFSELVRKKDQFMVYWDFYLLLSTILKAFLQKHLRPSVMFTLFTILSELYFYL